MKNETFQAAIKALFPKCKEDSVKQWLEWAEEMPSYGQFVNFIPAPGQIAAQRWLDTLFTSIYQVDMEYGNEIAT